MKPSLLTILIYAGFAITLCSAEPTTPMEPAPAHPDNLPKVLLIGDSISEGYSKEVKRILDGRVAVSGPIANAEATINGVANLDKWLGNTKWDLIHFNWGLWDIYGWKYAKDDRSPAMYEKRLESLVVRLEKTGAKLIWATTTPVCREAEVTMLKQFKTEVKISLETEQEYRDAALRVMTKHGIEVDDLQAAIQPKQADFQAADNVHFSGAGYGLLAKQVANAIAATFTAQATATNDEADIVVYGDAAGGVTAAVQAARMGKKVILISPFGHLGGMTSSGLGWTDIGSTAILGGISHEFYHRVYQHYQQAAAWTQEPHATFKNLGQGAPALDPKTELASTFEPKVAEQVFDAMVKEAGIRVIHSRLDLDRKVTKSGTKISAIPLEGGATVQGKMFLDASYEGDLMAAVGVSFVVGREANAEYHETSNGITGPKGGNQLKDGIDPYVVKGDPASGLLPGVNPDMGGKVGDADHRLQAYCYRMVLTSVAGNRVPIPKPANYQEADYEILFRAIEGGQTSRFFKSTLVPNQKTDANNDSGISCDWIGYNYGKEWNWATLNHRQREELAAKHRDWQFGMLWTLQNHPRVPADLRTKLSVWGLAKDEFKDNGNWPYNLYIREARRMKSDFVMTENHCLHKLPVEDPVGLGAYTLDSHNVQRFISNGMIKNEGDIQAKVGQAYGISYRSLVPRASECGNLLVPWALSATHIAFGSIRMEPVFMVLGQSSATAAVMAIDSGVSVQEVPYQALRDRLLKDGQRVDPPGK